MRSENEILEMLNKVSCQTEALDELYEGKEGDISSLSYTPLRDRLDAIRDTLNWCHGNDKHLELCTELC